MVGTHTNAVFNKLTKPQLVQHFLNTGANNGNSKISTLTAEVKDLSNYFKKLEADVATNGSAGKTPSTLDASV